MFQTMKDVREIRIRDVGEGEGLTTIFVKDFSSDGYESNDLRIMGAAMTVSKKQLRLTSLKGLDSVIAHLKSN